MTKPRNLPIRTLDLETDPFVYRRLPKPFAAGIYDGNEYRHFWRKYRAKNDVVKESVTYLKNIEPGYIFIHNGGKFDLFYYLEYIEPGTLFILNNRIVKCKIAGHEIRDSFAIMPFALAGYKKDEIDYGLMEAEKRDKNRAKILDYLFGDCKYLWDLCSRFVERFGARLTIGSTALNELKQRHTFKTISKRDDDYIRSKYYFGGRVQCFEQGNIETPVKIYDVNSMYPFVMKNFQHPLGAPSYYDNKITADTFFLTARGISRGAFNYRDDEGKTSYREHRGIFSTTIHEYRTALDFGLFETERIEETVNFTDRGTFQDFVDDFYREREQAKISGDDITNIFTKFILNSAYGKFAQNPENAFDFRITKVDEILEDPWEPSWVAEGKYVIWKKPSIVGERLRVNVCTAASITGSSRAVLLRAIARANRPLYCDTDSIICSSLEGVEIDAAKLGAWKLEKEGTRASVAGRKMYAIFDGKECNHGKSFELDKKNKVYRCPVKRCSNSCVKFACKGVRINPIDIIKVCEGQVIEFRNQVPSFKFDGTHRFITREVRMT